MFSVLCSAVQEGIAAILDLRARTLEKGLRNLLDDDGGETGGAPTPARAVPGPTAVGGAAAAAPAPAATAESGAAPPVPGADLTDQVLGQGLIRTTYKDAGWFLRLFGRRGRRGPSYIPPRTFALALLNVVAPTSADDDIGKVRKAISDATWIPAGTRSALASLASDVAKDRDHLRTEVENWFDATMDRVSGWYKRQAQIVICVLSLIVAVGLNVNTVSIAERLINDDTVRAAVSQDAVNAAAKKNESPNVVANQISDVQKLGIPFGWDKKSGDPADASLSHHFGRTVGGWLLTFLALSLGAPFWFGALSKLAGLRATGSPPKPSSTSTGSSGS